MSTFYETKDGVYNFKAPAIWLAKLKHFLPEHAYNLHYNVIPEHAYNLHYIVIPEHAYNLHYIVIPEHAYNLHYIVIWGYSEVILAQSLKQSDLVWNI